MSGGDLVEATVVSGPAEAVVVTALLAAAGIRSTAVGDAITAGRPPMKTAVAGVRILVRADQLADAQELLAGGADGDEGAGTGVAGGGLQL